MKWERRGGGEGHEGLKIQVRESGLELNHSRKQLQSFRAGMAWLEMCFTMMTRAAVGPMRGQGHEGNRKAMAGATESSR